jgi:hypothetical protein
MMGPVKIRFSYIVSIDRPGFRLFDVAKLDAPKRLDYETASYSTVVALIGLACWLIDLSATLRPDDPEFITPFTS